MSQAFDTPDRGLLMEILEAEVNIGEDELRLIRVLLAEIKLQLKIDNIKRRTVHKLDRSTTGIRVVTQAILSLYGTYQKKIYEKKQERTLGFKHNIC
jgi:hypothetical protein